MHDDARRWDERYSTVTRIDAEPPEVLQRWPHLTSLVPMSGRCVDVACGPGSVTMWMAARGLDVVALDASAVAIDLLRAAASSAGWDDRIDARIIDLDDGLPDDLDDLDLIVCQRFRDPVLYPVVIDRLRAGGVAIITVLSTVGASEPGAFHAAPGELDVAFTNDRCEILHHNEDGGVAHVVIRRR